MTSRLVIAVTAVLLAACGGGDSSPAHWSYEGEEGPEEWGQLDPAYAACADGTSQAPIDVVGPTPADLVDPDFSYVAGDAEVVDTGHTIQANAEGGSTLTVEGAEYPLAQLHFHAPSEHTVDGARSPVEAHFVHKTDDERIAVVGVILTAGDAPNKAWQPFVDALTVEEDESVTASIDWGALLPEDRTTIRYEGSLTTPPCTEGVHWLLMQETVALGADQLAAFEAAYSENNRPLQPLNGRAVEIDAEDG